MQTITDKAEVGLFLKNMSQSLADLSSWQNWYVFEMSAATPLIWTHQAKITGFIHTLFPDNDGSILWTEGNVMCIVRVTEDFDFATFAKGMYELKETPKITLRMLSVSEEREPLLELIHRYTTNTVPPVPPPYAGYTELRKLVPNIDELIKNWNVVKQQRKGRTQPTIMVVDDDTMLLTLVRHILKTNHMVITAKNGREAMEKHLQEAPDIVFLDIGLPDCSGMTLLNYIQQYDDECRIVMFSADNYLKTRINALSGGAAGFVPKPFSKEAFEIYIARWHHAEPEKKKG